MATKFKFCLKSSLLLWSALFLVLQAFKLKDHIVHDGNLETIVAIQAGSVEMGRKLQVVQALIPTITATVNATAIGAEQVGLESTALDRPLQALETQVLQNSNTLADITTTNTTFLPLLTARDRDLTHLTDRIKDELEKPVGNAKDLGPFHQKVVQADAVVATVQDRLMRALQRIGLVEQEMAGTFKERRKHETQGMWTQHLNDVHQLSQSRCAEGEEQCYFYVFCHCRLAEEKVEEQK